MIDFGRLARRRIVENDSGLASQKNRLRRRRIALCLDRLSEQLAVEFGRSRTIAGLDGNVVNSARMKQGFLFGPALTAEAFGQHLLKAS